MVQVTEGVFWVQMPLPFAPRHVNIWLLRDSDSWTIVDAGFPSSEAYDAWEQILAKLDAPVRRIIATHGHADHACLLGYLCGQTGASLTMSRLEWAWARSMQVKSELIAYEDFAHRLGLPDAVLRDLRVSRQDFFNSFADLPERFTPIEDHDPLDAAGRRWQAIGGGGHAPEMLGFRSEGVLIGADHILPQIVVAQTYPLHERGVDPLARQFEILDRLEGLPADTLVLPSHGAPFYGLHQRTHEVREAHNERLARLNAIVERPMTVWDAMPSYLGREPRVDRAFLASSEAYTHLVHLALRGVLTQEDAPGQPTIFRRA